MLCCNHINKQSENKQTGKTASTYKGTNKSQSLVGHTNRQAQNLRQRIFPAWPCNVKKSGVRTHQVFTGGFIHTKIRDDSIAKFLE